MMDCQYTFVFDKMEMATMEANQDDDLQERRLSARSSYARRP